MKTKDEQLHVDTFAKIFQTILAENPEQNNDALRKFVYDTMREAADLEIKWAHHIIGNDFDGISIDELEDYIRFMANKRCIEMGFDRCFPLQSRENPLRWIKVYENNNDSKQDFFEGKPRTYVKVTEDQGFGDL